MRKCHHHRKNLRVLYPYTQRTPSENNRVWATSIHRKNCYIWRCQGSMQSYKWNFSTVARKPWLASLIFACNNGRYISFCSIILLSLCNVPAGSERVLVTSGNTWRASNCRNAIWSSQIFVFVFFSEMVPNSEIWNDFFSPSRSVGGRDGSFFHWTFCSRKTHGRVITIPVRTSGKIPPRTRKDELTAQAPMVLFLPPFRAYCAHANPMMGPYQNAARGSQYCPRNHTRASPRIAGG